MRLAITKRTSRDIPFGLIYGTIAFLAVTAARFLPVQNILPRCHFKDITGMPCPTCGTTRLLTHLAHGDLAGALGLNPAVALAVFAAIVLFAYDAATGITGSRISFDISHRDARWIRSLVVAALLANWFYLAVYL